MTSNESLHIRIGSAPFEEILESTSFLTWDFTARMSEIEIIDIVTVPSFCRSMGLHFNALYGGVDWGVNLDWINTVEAYVGSVITKLRKNPTWWAHTWAHDSRHEHYLKLIEDVAFPEIP